jgi:uncharacterized protein (DUF4415 family)
MAKTSKPESGASRARSGSAPSGRLGASASKPKPVGRPQIDTGRAGWATDLVFDVREPKLAVSLRLDADVLRFFRGFGSGYQTRINEVLKAFMIARGGAENGAHSIPAARLPRASNGGGSSKRVR